LVVVAVAVVVVLQKGATNEKRVSVNTIGSICAQYKTI
jgi:hypothetical protein